MHLSIHTTPPFPALLYAPEAVESRPTWPLVLFLHGSGERGDDPTLVRKYALPQALDAGLELPAFVYAPQCPAGERWEALAPRLLAELDAVCARLPVERSRLSLTGFSMGGQGAWALALAAPQRWAAVAPVAGRLPDAGDFGADAAALARLPLWLAHSTGDDVVPARWSDKAAAALAACGHAAGLRYTRYDGLDHLETAAAIYSDAAFLAWLVRQSL